MYSAAPSTWLQCDPLASQWLSSCAGVPREGKGSDQPTDLGNAFPSDLSYRMSVRAGPSSTAAERHAAGCEGTAPCTCARRGPDRSWATGRLLDTGIPSMLACTEERRLAAGRQRVHALQQHSLLVLLTGKPLSRCGREVLRPNLGIRGGLASGGGIGRRLVGPGPARVPAACGRGRRGEQSVGASPAGERVARLSGAMWPVMAARRLRDRSEEAIQSGLRGSSQRRARTLGFMRSQAGDVCIAPPSGVTHPTAMRGGIYDSQGAQPLCSGFSQKPESQSTETAPAQNRLAPSTADRTHTCTLFFKSFPQSLRLKPSGNLWSTNCQEEEVKCWSTNGSILQ